MGAGLNISIMLTDLKDRNGRDQYVQHVHLWLNTELAGYEFNAKNGFTFSMAVGVTARLTGDLILENYCSASGKSWFCGVENEFPVWPTTRIGVGWRF